MFLPKFMCCFNTRRNQSVDFLIQNFYLNCRKMENMKDKYVNIGAILL